MKKNITLSEQKISKIIKKILKEEESEQKFNNLLKNLENDLNSDMDFEQKVEKNNVCNVCIKGIENVEKIPSCRKLCEKGRKKRKTVSDCINEFSLSKYSGGNKSDTSPRLRLLMCLTKIFKLKMIKPKKPKTFNSDELVFDTHQSS